ncbi:unnamed protein product, partial [Discosporangium mesarthrocarpum]
MGRRFIELLMIFCNVAVSHVRNVHVLGEGPLLIFCAWRGRLGGRHRENQEPPLASELPSSTLQQALIDYAMGTVRNGKADVPGHGVRHLHGLAVSPDPLCCVRLLRADLQCRMYSYFPEDGSGQKGVCPFPKWISFRGTNTWQHGPCSRWLQGGAQRDSFDILLNLWSDTSAVSLFVNENTRGFLLTTLDSRKGGWGCPASGPGTGQCGLLTCFRLHR